MQEDDFTPASQPPARQTDGRPQAVVEPSERWFDKIQCGVLALDQDRIILTANRVAGSLLGIEPQQLVGRDILEFVHTDSWETAVSILGHAVRQGDQSPCCVVTFLSRNGQPLSMGSAACGIEWNGVAAALVTFFDVTKYEQMQHTLEDSKQMLRTIIDLIPYSIFAKDIEGRILLANEATALSFDSSVEKVTGRLASELITNSDEFSLSRDTDLKVFASGKSLHLEDILYTDIEGNERYMDIMKIPFSLPGNPLPVVLGIAIDTTDRKKREARLAESEANFRTLTDAAREGIVVADSNRRIVFANEEAHRILSLERGRLIGLDVSGFAKPEEQEAGRQRFDDVLHSRRQPQREAQWIRTADNRSIIIEIISTMTPWNGQRALMFIFHDVTKQKQMEEEIVQHRKILEQKLAERTEYIRQLERQESGYDKQTTVSGLVGRVAHEINNPLGGIRNALQLVKDQIDMSAPYAKYITLIEQEIERMRRIVRSLYDTNNPHVKAKCRFDVMNSVARVIALLEAESQKYAVRIEAKLLTTRTEFFGSEDSFQQILFNVIKNAIEASKPADSVIVELFVNEHGLDAAVLDSGEGMTEQTRARLLEPFFTTKHGIDSMSLGLGLPICKNLIDLCGGTMQFESSPGIGTTVRVHIPAVSEKK